MARADIKEIRQRFEHADGAWMEDYKQGRRDMQYVAGKIWTREEKQKRAGRPTMVFDEFGSYTNRVINNLRMNKRAIIAIPKGGGANEQTARLTADKIREIQYQSQAQAAFITAAENAIQRGIGFVRISKEYVSETSMDQTLRITRVPNPLTILIDPDFKEASAADKRYAFVTDQWSRAKFRQKFPKAASVDAEKMGLSAKHWGSEETVMVREHWGVEEKPDTLYVVQSDDDTIAPVLLSKAKGVTIADGGMYIDGARLGAIAGERKTSRSEVYQQITNGVEVLEEVKWDGRYIPIIPMFGKEIWVGDSEEGNEKRQFYSLIRLARDPAQLLCFYRSTEAEVISQSPKNPYMAYKGQIAGNESDWQESAERPVAVLEANATTDESGTQILPLPTRNSYEPPVQALNLGSESARRGIQSAMGIDTLPTAAQRQNQKSGIALEKINEQQNLGSFHFVDSYDSMLSQTGRILADQCPHVYDTKRTIQVMGPDEKYRNEDIEGTEFRGEHEVIIKVGPSQDSERDEALEFASQLATPELIGAAIGGNPKASKIAGMAIRLRAGGPLMDAIADTLDPPEDTGGDPKQALAQLQMQAQQAGAVIEQLTQQNEVLKQELAAAQNETASKERMNAQDNAVKLLIEEMDRDLKAGLARHEQELARLKAVLDAEMQTRGHELTRIDMMAKNSPQPEPQQEMVAT